MNAPRKQVFVCLPRIRYSNLVSLVWSAIVCEIVSQAIRETLHLFVTVVICSDIKMAHPAAGQQENCVARYRPTSHNVSASCKLGDVRRRTPLAVAKPQLPRAQLVSPTFHLPSFSVYRRSVYTFHSRFIQWLLLTAFYLRYSYACSLLLPYVVFLSSKAFGNNTK